MTPKKTRIRRGRHFWLAPKYDAKLNRLFRRVRKANPGVHSDTAALRLLIDQWDATFKRSR